MKIDPRSQERSLYRTLSGAVVPRPIAWVSTTGSSGTDNLAPFSFFTVACIDPPVLSVAPGGAGTGGPKDTLRNVIDTGEFVVNVVTEPLAEAMNETSASLPAEESEFDHADVARARSERVEPPRVGASPVAFECELADVVEIGSNSLVLGEVVFVHVDDDVTTDGKLDVTKLDAVGRLAGSWYTYTEDRFRLERPP